MHHWVLREKKELLVNFRGIWLCRSWYSSRTRAHDLYRLFLINNPKRLSFIIMLNWSIFLVIFNHQINQKPIVHHAMNLQTLHFLLGRKLSTWLTRAELYHGPGDIRPTHSILSPGPWPTRQSWTELWWYLVLIWKDRHIDHMANSSSGAMLINLILIHYTNHVLHWRLLITILVVVVVNRHRWASLYCTLLIRAAIVISKNNNVVSPAPLD